MNLDGYRCIVGIQIISFVTGFSAFSLTFSQIRCLISWVSKYSSIPEVRIEKGGSHGSGRGEEAVFLREYIGRTA